jgi:hypothetical protein
MPPAFRGWNGWESPSKRRVLRLSPNLEKNPETLSSPPGLLRKYSSADFRNNYKN